MTSPAELKAAAAKNNLRSVPVSNEHGSGTSKAFIATP